MVVMITHVRSQTIYGYLLCVELPCICMGIYYVLNCQVFGEATIKDAAKEIYKLTIKFKVQNA